MSHIIDYTESKIGNTTVITWAGLTDKAIGKPFEYPTDAHPTATFSGEFGAIGIVRLRGSNDGASFHNVNDITGSEICKIRPGSRRVADTPAMLRPEVDGDKETSITVALAFRL